MKRYFLEEALRSGAILGLVLTLSMIVERELLLSGSLELLIVLAAEWLAMAVVHYWLLFRYTKRFRSGLFPEDGFSYLLGYGFVLTMSAVAGVIVGAVKVVYLYLVMGYDHYMDRVVGMMRAWAQRCLVESPELAPEVAELEKSLPRMYELPQPQWFESMWSSMVVTLLFGVVAGAVIAIHFHKRPYEIR